MDKHLFKYMFPSCSKTCLNCSKSFQIQELIYSSFGRKLNGKQREDLWSLCWKRQEESSTKQHKIFWKSRLKKERDKKITVSTKAYETLKSLSQSINNNKDAEMAYLLALFMERNKELIIRKDLGKNDKTCIYCESLVQGGDILKIKKINLTQIDSQDCMPELNILIREFYA